MATLGHLRPAPEGRGGRHPRPIAAGAAALVLLAAYACVDHSAGDSPKVAATAATVTPTPAPVAPAGAIASPPACPSVTGYPTVGTLTVLPACFHVGDTVVIEGRGCHNPGAAPRLVFGNDGDSRLGGTVGAADPLPTPALTANDIFEVRYTVPALLHTYQGRGGGRLAPGTYAFWSEPPFCMASVVVLPD